MIPKHSQATEPSIVPPANLEEAERLRLHLVSKVEEITAQLGNKNKSDANGVRLSTEEWWRWRSSAIYALRYKQSQLRELNLWIEQHNKKTPEYLRLLSNVKEVLEELQEDDILHAEELDLLKEIKACVGAAFKENRNGQRTRPNRSM